MTEALPIPASNVQLQPLPNLDFVSPFIFSTEVIAASLAFAIALYSSKLYRRTGFLYLLDLSIGFWLIMFSEALLASDVLMKFDPVSSNFLFWLRLLSLSSGFSFIALSYRYKHMDEARTPILMIAAFSVIPLMIMMTIMVLAKSIVVLPPYSAVDQYFHVFNILILGYIIKSILGSIVEHGRKQSTYILAAYLFLGIGQFSSLIFGLGGDAGAFVSEHVARVFGLAIFVVLLYQIKKMKRVAIMRGGGRERW